MTRYLLALLLLSHLAVFLWHRANRVNDCGDRRCVQRDREFLRLLEQHRKLQKEANLLSRQVVFLANAARKHRARADFFAARTVEEAEDYLRRQG